MYIVRVLGGSFLGIMYQYLRHMHISFVSKDWVGFSRLRVGLSTK